LRYEAVALFVFHAREGDRTVNGVVASSARVSRR
jgi:hypothetical protein